MKGTLLFAMAEIPKEVFTNYHSRHVIQIKTMMIAYMRDELKYSFEKIGEILERDRTSISDLYQTAEQLKKDIPYLAEWYKHFDTRYTNKMEYQLKMRR